MLWDGWYCQFLEADLKTPLPRKVTFATPEKVVELAERGRGLKDLASKYLNMVLKRDAVEFISSSRLTNTTN
jgi:hypothetical protein